MVGRSAGVVIMAPPDDSAEAQKALATLLSSLKPKQKVCAFCAHVWWWVWCFGALGCD